MVKILQFWMNLLINRTGVDKILLRGNSPNIDNLLI